MRGQPAPTRHLAPRGGGEGGEGGEGAMDRPRESGHGSGIGLGSPTPTPRLHMPLGAGGLPPGSHSVVNARFAPVLGEHRQGHSGVQPSSSSSSTPTGTWQDPQPGGTDSITNSSQAVDVDEGVGITGGHSTGDGIRAGAGSRSRGETGMDMNASVHTTGGNAGNKGIVYSLETTADLVTELQAMKRRAAREREALQAELETVRRRADLLKEDLKGAF